MRFAIKIILHDGYFIQVNASTQSDWCVADLIQHVSNGVVSIQPRVCNFCDGSDSRFFLQQRLFLSTAESLKAKVWKKIWDIELLNVNKIANFVTLAKTAGLKSQNTAIPTPLKKRKWAWATKYVGYPAKTAANSIGNQEFEKREFVLDLRFACTQFQKVCYCIRS